MNHETAFLKQPAQKNEPAQKSVRNRLQELLLLEDGWLNGEGKVLSPSGIEHFAASFEKYFNAILPMPYLFPTYDGNLQAEWVINNVDVSLKIDLAKLNAFYQASSDNSKHTDEITLNLTQKAGWQQLSQKLTTLSKV